MSGCPGGAGQVVFSLGKYRPGEEALTPRTSGGVVTGAIDARDVVFDDGVADGSRHVLLHRPAAGLRALIRIAGWYELPGLTVVTS